MSKQLTGQVTPEQIQSWKNEHGKIYTYTVEGKICYLRTISRDLYSLAASKVASSPAKFNEVIINGIWLGGDETIRKEDQYYFGLSDYVEDLMNKKKGELGEC